MPKESNYMPLFTKYASMEGIATRLWPLIIFQVLTIHLSAAKDKVSKVDQITEIVLVGKNQRNFTSMAMRKKSELRRLLTN